MDRIITKYKDQVRQIVYHVFWEPKASQANKAALCAGAQGKYWDFRQSLFSKQDQWSRNSSLDGAFKGYARELGLDESSFSACLASDRFQDRLLSEMDLARAYNVDTTPTIFINKQRFVGAVPFEVLDAAIRKELKK